MKRRLSTSVSPSNKRWRDLSLNEIFQCYRQEAINAPPICTLVGDTFQEILDHLEPPWHWTLKYALTGKAPRKTKFNKCAYEIVKYGLPITQWFYARDLIGKKKLAAFACYYGHWDLYKWGRSLNPNASDTTMYLYAVFGGQYETIMKLRDDRVDFSRAELLGFVIYTGQLELLKKLTGTVLGGLFELRADDKSLACQYSQLEIYKWLKGQISTFFDSLEPVRRSFLKYDLQRVLEPRQHPFHNRSLTDQPPEIIQFINNDNQYDRQTKLIEYFQEQGAQLEPTMIDGVTDEPTVLLLIDRGFILTEDRLRWLLSNHMATEPFLVQVISKFSFSQPLYSWLMSRSIFCGWFQLVCLLRKKGTPWSRIDIDQVFWSRKIPLRWFFDNGYPFIDEDLMRITNLDGMVGFHKHRPSLKFPMAGVRMLFLNYDMYKDHFDYVMKASPTYDSVLMVIPIFLQNTELLKRLYGLNHRLGEAFLVDLRKTYILSDVQPIQGSFPDCPELDLLARKTHEWVRERSRFLETFNISTEFFPREVSPANKIHHYIAVRCGQLVTIDCLVSRK